MLRKSGPARALDSCHRPEGSWALGTRMLWPWRCLRLLCQYFNANFPLFSLVRYFSFSRKLWFLWLIDNRTEWSPIQSVIILVITKSDSRCAVVRFCYHSYDYRLNWTPLSPITITNWTPLTPITITYYISKGLQFMFLRLQRDRRYLCLPSKWQIFGKLVELCTARIGECPQILFYAFLHWC